MRTVKAAQKLLIQKRVAFSKISSRHYAEMDALVQEIIKGGCDHTKTSDYHWEWDNGYGRQSRMTGKTCDYCGWVNLWGSSWCSRSDLRN